MNLRETIYTLIKEELGQYPRPLETWECKNKCYGPKVAYIKSINRNNVIYKDETGFSWKTDLGQFLNNYQKSDLQLEEESS